MSAALPRIALTLPVKKIAAQSETGPATTILAGISGGMVSVASSVALILIGVGVG